MTQTLNTVLNLAYIYLNYGKTKRAIDYLLIANRLAPSNIQVMKMQIVAFKDIKAYPQAMTLIDALDKNPLITPLDKVTLDLMKSFCLQGMNDMDTAKIHFNRYVTNRRELALNTYMEKSKKSDYITLNDDAQDTYNLVDDMDDFVKKGFHASIKENRPTVN
jgi:uncharacterized protein HemY